MDQKWMSQVSRRLKPDGSAPWWTFVRAGIAGAMARYSRPVVLDVGCGPACGMYTSLGASPGLHIGMDVDPAGSHNTEIGTFVRGSAYQIPLAEGSVDVLISGYILEHLSDPSAALREFSRVLKPGGVLFLWTSNLLNYAMLVSSVTPTGFHNWVRRLGKLLEDSDNSHTYYRANTPRALRRSLRDAGLTLNRPMIFGANAYNYWSFSKPLFTLAVLGSRAASVTPLRCLKSTLIVECGKTSAPPGE